jgi:Fe2+ transport system protein FeoA
LIINEFIAANLYKLNLDKLVCYIYNLIELTIQLAGGVMEAKLNQEISLSELKPGVKAGIVCMQCGEEVSQRLQELGFVPGAEIEVLDTGCPLLVRVEDARICLREAHAQGVRVSPALEGLR